MSAVKASNKDIHKATAVTLIVIGMLYLIDKLIHFSALGILWVMDKDNPLFYIAVVFLFVKRDKSVGLVLFGLWLVLDIGLIILLLGSMPGYLLSLALLIIGGILCLIST